MNIVAPAFAACLGWGGLMDRPPPECVMIPLDLPVRITEKMRRCPELTGRLRDECLRRVEK